MNDQVQTEVTTTEVFKRGFCGRNGRVAILEDIFANASSYQNTNAMYVEAESRFANKGIPGLKKTSFAAMFSTWKAKQVKATETVAAATSINEVSAVQPVAVSESLFSQSNSSADTGVQA